MDKCNYKKQHCNSWGKTYKSICNKPSTHLISGQPRCRYHAKVGRYVFRDGEIGEILARFDTEDELRRNKQNFPSATMQKLTKSKRVTLH